MARIRSFVPRPLTLAYSSSMLTPRPFAVTVFGGMAGVLAASSPGVRSMTRGMSTRPDSTSTAGLRRVVRPSRRHSSSLIARHWSMLLRVSRIFLRVRRLAAQMTMWLCK